MPPRLDLRRGVDEPVVFARSPVGVQQADLPSVPSCLRVVLATREDAWRHRSQMTLVFDEFNDDPREPVDIPKPGRCCVA